MLVSTFSKNYFRHRQLMLCSVAIREARRKGLLHRDISIGNIMAKLDASRCFVGGILIDWDLSGTTTDRSPNRGRVSISHYDRGPNIVQLLTQSSGNLAFLICAAPQISRKAL